MNVLADATIVKPELAGIATYIRGVLGSLTRQPGIRLEVITSMAERFSDMRGVEVVTAPLATRSFAGRALWRESMLPRLVQARQADVVFVPFPEIPFRRLSAPSVLVVYDVGPLVAPALYTRAKRARFAFDLGRACRAATRIVCLSHATVVGLRVTVGADPAKCEVIGAAPTPRPQVGRATHGVGPEPYVLYVGTLLPHKNVSTLVRAFGAAGDGLPCRLLLAGPATSEQRRAFESLVEDLGVGARVRHLGWVSYPELTSLYRNAVAVAVPSLHEGYGLPVLEAMDAAVPVVASDIPTIREVAGDAVAYVSRPLDEENWRAVLREVSHNPARRAQLVALGRARARATSWEEVGRQYAALFDAVVAGTAGGRS